MPKGWIIYRNSLFTCSGSRRRLNVIGSRQQILGEIEMRKVILFGIIAFAAGYAYEEYTGKSVIYSFKSIAFGGGGGGFAGGYGMAVDSGRSMGQSAAGLGSAVGARMGSLGN
jgi:hypothetical protein